MVLRTAPRMVLREAAEPCRATPGFWRARAVMRPRMLPGRRPVLLRGPRRAFRARSRPVLPNRRFPRSAVSMPREGRAGRWPAWGRRQPQRRRRTRAPRAPARRARAPVIAAILAVREQRLTAAAAAPRAVG